MASLRTWLLLFLEDLEYVIPPNDGGHHSITRQKYGCKETDWKEELVLSISSQGRFYNFFLDIEDFDKSPKQLADDICALHTKNLAAAQAVAKARLQTKGCA